ncbi:Predicted integral membrane protein [Paenibacillus sp. UNC496MF]|uniref:DUF2269 family protein n=1 Tax=Paenibacillus sp. UNC496MF TaxID=1502753 RepID=UPI0008E26A10|nr:DUF2269 family protein [Paenibacillus sp. UNC496MF]SFJ35710.1 Predicted integral membrane protein [Paenibacillus sp. UNC496MF]
MSWFGLLLVAHVLAAIAIIGPAFMMPLIRRSAGTVGQLRFAFGITARLAVLPKLGGFVLLITGVWLMILTRAGLSQMWLNAAILLSLLMVVLIDGWIEPRLKKIMKLIAERQDGGSELPAELGPLIKRIVPVETASQLLMIAILALMVLKPF